MTACALNAQRSGRRSLGQTPRRCSQFCGLICWWIIALTVYSFHGLSPHPRLRYRCTRCAASGWCLVASSVVAPNRNWQATRWWVGRGLMCRFRLRS